MAGQCSAVQCRGTLCSAGERRAGQGRAMQCSGPAARAHSLSQPGTLASSRRRAVRAVLPLRRQAEFIQRVALIQRSLAGARHLGVSQCGRT